MIFWAILGAIVFIVARHLCAASRDPIREWFDGVRTITIVWALLAFLGGGICAVSLLIFAWKVLP